MNRGEIEVETLLKVVLALAIVWLVVEILETFLAALLAPVRFLLGPLQPVLGLVLVVLIVLWLFDRV